MTHEVILEFVVPAALVIALATLLSIGAVSLTNMYLGPVEQSGVPNSVAAHH
jgi:hypothetical protein